MQKLIGPFIGILLILVCISTISSEDAWNINKIAIIALTITWWALGIRILIKRRK